MVSPEVSAAPYETGRASPETVAVKAAPANRKVLREGAQSEGNMAFSVIERMRYEVWSILQRAQCGKASVCSIQRGRLVQCESSLIGATSKSRSGSRRSVGQYGSRCVPRRAYSGYGVSRGSLSARRKGSLRSPQ